MGLVNNYNEYIIESLLESVKKDEFYLIISNELFDILNSLDNDISKRIIEYSNKGGGYYENKYKITFLDLTDKKDASDNPIYDNISFMSSNKLIEIASKELGVNYKDVVELEENYDKIRRLITHNKQHYFSLSNRTDTSIGRIVRKLFNNEFTDIEIEDFVNKFKSERDISKDFELIKGEDIIHWYNEKQYIEGGVLGDSCMRYDSCSSYINFYAENSDKISLLILHDNNNPDKIRGRALVWNLDEPKNRIYMDRIFYISDYIMDLFKKYAKDQGWLYKKNQNNSSDGPFIDTVNDETLYDMKLVVNDIKDIGKYPYLDTIKYLKVDTLTNYIDEEANNEEVKKLTRTNGSYRDVGYYSSYYDEVIDLSDYNMCLWINDYRNNEDSFYSDFYDGYIDNDYAGEHGVWCYYSDDNSWRKENDYVIVSNGKKCAKDYAEDNFEYSDYSDEWVVSSVYSDHHGTYINDNDAIQVYTKADKSENDWRANDDDTFWKSDEGDYYDNSIDKKDI